MQEKNQGFQLSPQQKRLWCLQEDSKVYRVQCAILIEGNLKVEVLKEALQTVVSRNEILRTNFHRPRGIKIPIQVIESASVVSLCKHSLECRESHEKEIDILLQQRREGNLNFEKDKLLQTDLINLSPQKYVLLANLPALCADYATLKNLVREISQCYAACLHNEKLDDEPLQYADIAEWQNELLESEDTEVGREYWCQQDLSSLETLNLISKKRTSDKLGFEPKLLRVLIQPEILVKIEALVCRYDASVSEFLLACWQILLWRITGQSDLIVGMANDGRKYEELKEVLGLLTKYLPLKCHFKDDHKFPDILAMVKKSAHNAYIRQEYFTWELINKMVNNIETKFFPFCFDFEEVSKQYSTSNISFSIEQIYACIDRFEVKLFCCRQHNIINAEFHYDANLFSVTDIQRLAEQFQTLLVSIINYPETAISKLEILSSIEHQQLIVEFNNTRTDYPKNKCIHQLFEEQVVRTPDKIAVVFKTQQLTYRQLNAKANQVAHYLQGLGVGTETLVGICVERSLEMIIGLLGILKAGAAYVPIDPNYPLERKAFILKDTQTPVLLTQQHLATDLPTDTIQVICLDTNWQTIAQEQTQNPLSQATSDNLVYVIYTSGSTGKPKGTLIIHRGLVNYLTWCTQAYQVEQGVGTIVHSPLSFDLTITGLFSPLLVGRQVELIPDEFSVESLSATLRKSLNLSLVKITPAQLLLLSQQLPASEAAGRTRALIIGGENLLAESITFWQDYAPETMLINEYGPTETVVGCCIYQVPCNEQLSGSIPIGHPIANTQLYVLNQDLQPVPTGVVGELYIGGVGLARGYLNQPTLTAEKFIPNPFNDELGTRLYKTGDLVRHLPDGNLEFLGRIDHQVKVRGFRIELGEIEGLLNQHPEVREAVVLVREDIPGDHRLVAYIVAYPATSLISTLQNYLQQYLLKYMMPSAFVLLPNLPLTINGKVDRRALPAPDSFRPEFELTYKAPQTEVEQTITKIWQDLLHVERVGINDNFFALGGHSLLLVQVHSKLREVLKTDISVTNLFEYPTISSLAKYLTQEQTDTSDFDEIRKRSETRRNSKIIKS